MASPTETNFVGQVAVVTGGGGGLGSSYCRELARRGAAVVVNDLGGDTAGAGSSVDYADRVVREIRDAGGRAVANYDTVGTEAGGEAIVDAAMREFGRLDAVISNAGNQRNGLFGTLAANDIEAVHSVHVLGAFYVCQPAYRVMTGQGYGRIVLVSSQSGMFGNPFRSSYGSAKTAMIGLMNTIAQEAPSGVSVNCLFPTAGGGRLGAADPRQRPDAQWLAEMSKRSALLTTGGTPEWVTPMAVYLSSRACSTSQNMYSVLGGRYSRIFVGLTEGWIVHGTEAPSCEELVENLSKVDELTRFDVPLSGLGEMEATIAARSRAR